VARAEKAPALDIPTGIYLTGQSGDATATRDRTIRPRLGRESPAPGDDAGANACDGRVTHHALVAATSAVLFLV